MSYGPIQTFDTILQAAKATLNGVNTVFTAGYSSIGFGGGTYKRVNSQPPHAMKFQSADGLWFEYKPDVRGVCANAAGAVADGTINLTTNVMSGTDNTQLIQNAVDYALYYKLKVVYLLNGAYRITSPIQLNYGIGFSDVGLEGSGSNYKTQEGGSSLLCNFSNASGISVQGGREIRISKLTMFGMNYSWIVNEGLMGNSPSVDDKDVANWLNPALDANAAGRYTINAAIAVDPYGGPQPTPHYPSVTYPAWLLGAGVPQYNKNLTSGLIIDDVQIYGFVSALAIQPCNDDGNGDFIKLHNVIAGSNTYVITAGNSQGRVVTTLDCVFGSFHTGVNNILIGMQVGCLELLSLNSTWEDAIQLFDVDSSVSRTFTYCGGHSENLYRIGNWGVDSSGNNPLSFLGYNFNFTAQSDADGGRGVPAAVLSGGFPSSASFRGCAFSNFVSVIGISSQPLGSILIDNCAVRCFNGSSARSQTYQKIANNFLGGGVMMAPIFSESAPFPASFSVKTDTQFNITTGVAIGPAVYDNIFASYRAILGCAWSRWITNLNTPQHILPMAQVWRAINKPGGTTLVNGVLTMSLTITDAELLQVGPSPGDIIFDANTASTFFVRSAAAGSPGTIIAELQNNYSVIAGIKTPIDTISTSVGSLYIGNSRVYAPSDFTRGDLTSGSEIIANAGNAAGTSSFLTTEILVGDGIYIDPQMQSWLPQNKATVTIVDASGTPVTVTATGATESINHQDLGLFVRQSPPNV